MMGNSEVKSRRVKLDFVGVGAAKSATSWLAACLGEHPELCIAEPKSLNYFCEKANWPKFPVTARLGQKWFTERFVHCKLGQRLGEFSPSYLCDPKSPQLIYRHNPKCRLIFSFRHPVESLVSFYYQVRKEFPVAEVFEDFLNDYPEVERIGFYHCHVQLFLDVFAREQCLFLLFDDIQRDPAMILRRCFSFLGVAADFVSPSLKRRINERKTPRSEMLVFALNWLRRRIQGPSSVSMHKSWLWKLKLNQLHEWIIQRNLQPFTPPPLSKATRTRLLDLYRDDTRALASFLNRDLSSWEV
jgi:hypothetical protein